MPYESLATKFVGSYAVFNKSIPFTVPIPTLKGLGTDPDTELIPAPNSNSKVAFVVNLDTNLRGTGSLSIT